MAILLNLVKCAKYLHIGSTSGHEGCSTVICVSLRLATVILISHIAVSGHYHFLYFNVIMKYCYDQGGN